MDFVSGWTIMQTLGEGAYGEVKLLVNKDEGSAVAMKVINLQEHPEAETTVKKEINIHKKLNDSHIIKYYGQRSEDKVSYIFLEYAPGGELFDKIEPDVGMEVWEAQKYMKQLLSGVEYLHVQGVCHRDIKPENLLLDSNDNLKISDFGLATIFRLRGKSRLLDKKCGTVQYMSPEILQGRKYRAEPVDVWACGIVLVAMLAGELPWDRASLDCPEFIQWKKKETNWMSKSPWSKLDHLAIVILLKILHPQPSQRLDIPSIQEHRWCTKPYSQSKGVQPVDKSPLQAMKRLRSDISPPSNHDPRLCQSQPEMFSGHNQHASYGSPSDKEPPQFCFSQPAQIQDLLVSTQQYLATQSNNSQDMMQKLVRRMTRFFVSLDPLQAMDRLEQVVNELGLSYRSNTPGIVTLTTVDKHKNQLTFKAYIMPMDKQTLLDFRLSKGCGIEFKRRFLLIRKQLSDIVLKGLVSWPIAMATNNVP